MPKTHILAIGLAAVALASLSSADALAFTSPPPGSPVRAAIMDAVRPGAEDALGGPVKFKVKTVRVSGAWAYVSVEPLKPSGAPYRINRPEPMNAYAGALLQRRGGAWRVVEFRLGPTDVWYLTYCGQAPKDLLEGC